mgnify:CR=1 FL=1
MPSQIRISFAVSAAQDKKIKYMAKDENKTVSEFCRDRVTGESREVDPVLMENRVERLEYFIGELIKEHEFMQQVIYEFMCAAANKQVADEAIQRAKEKAIK